MFYYFDNSIIFSIHTLLICCHTLLNFESSIRDNVANICLIPEVLKKSYDIFDNSDIIFAFNTLKASSTEVTSGQYAGRNII